jgi:replicative superfamily II helicase
MVGIFKPIDSYLNYIDTKNNEKLNDLVKEHIQLLKRIDESEKNKIRSKKRIEKEIGARFEASTAFSLYGEILFLNKDLSTDPDEKWDDFFLLAARNYQKIIEILEIHNLDKDFLFAEDIYQLQLLSLFEFHSSRRHAIASAIGKKVLNELEGIERKPDKKYDKNLIELHRIIIYFLLAKFDFCKRNIPILLDYKINELKEGNYETNYELYDTIAVCYILTAIDAIIDYFENGNSQKLDQATENIKKSVEFSNASLRMDLRLFSNKLSLTFKILSSLSIWNIRVIFQVTETDSKGAVDEYIRLKIQNGNYFLFISQYKAIFEEKIFDTYGNTIISLPTGSGKTFLAELSIIKRLIEVKLERKTERTHLLYLVPSRALAREKFDDFTNIFGPLTTLKIKVCQLTGEIVLNSREAFEKNDLLIMTQEKFDMLLREKFFDSLIDTLIVDEFHNIRSGYRGLKLEFAILRFRGLPQFKDAKIILISAIVKEENFKEIGEWLYAENQFQTEWRPTFTRIGILDLEDPNRLINFNDGISIESQLPHEIYAHWTGKAAIWLTLKYAQTDPVLYFTTYTTNPQDGTNHLLDVASQFCSQNNHFSFNNESNRKLSAQLKRIVGDEKILHYFQQGVGVHWGFLPHSIRKIMENAVRQNAINVIISTSTLAEGVNLPIKTIIIPQLKIQGRFMEYGLFFNLIGRAGRPFMHDEGQVILLASNSGQYKNTLENVSKYSKATRKDIEDIRSPITQIFDLQNSRIPDLEIECSKAQNKNKERQLQQLIQELKLHIANLETVLLAMIEENLIDTLSDNKILIEKIKIGKLTPKEREQINTLLIEIEERMISKYKVLKRGENRILETTEFGKVVYKTGLSPESCFILYNTFTRIVPKIVDLNFSPRKLFKQENYEKFDLLFSPIQTIIESNAFFKYGFPFNAAKILIEWMNGLPINKLSRWLSKKESPKIETMILVETQLSTFSSWYFNSISQIISFIHEEKGIRDSHGLKSISLLSEYSWYGTTNENAIKIINLDISRELIRDDILIFIERIGSQFIEKMLITPEILQDPEIVKFIMNIEDFKMEPDEFIKILHKILSNK